MAFGIGGSKSSSQSTSSQSIFEADIFKKLFGGAANVAGGIDTTGLTEQANELFGSGSAFLGDLQEISAGEDVSGQFLTDLISGGSGLVDENISALSDDLSQFFNEELLPGITSEAVGGGQLGGGRQGVAQGKAVESIGREFRRGSLDIRNADLRQRQDAARELSAQRLSASQAGLTGAQQQFDLANAATNTPFSPFLTLAQILGAPTSLTESQSSSKSKNLGFESG
jgi:hypothetical protein